MRDVPSSMDNAWLSGNFTGTQRAMARVTVQHMNLALHETSKNLYASFIFGDQPEDPKELPNVKSVKWTRGVDTDVATCVIEFYNTAPQVLGTVFLPQYGLDQPGYYTYARGGTSFSSRWNQAANEWANLLLTDNIIRVFEGYGFDASMCPEDDPYLVQTGMWIIKDISFTVTGLITVQCEDMASILRDQVCFWPIIPKAFYPLAFSATPKVSGFNQGKLVTLAVDSGGGFDKNHPPPAGWSGPLTAVSGVTVSDGNGALTVNWTTLHDATVASTQATLATAAADLAHKRAIHASTAIINAAIIAYEHARDAAYEMVGYRVVLDNVQLPTVYSPTATTAAIARLDNGNTYLVQVAAVFKRGKDGHEEVGAHGAFVYAHPRSTTTGSVVPDSIQVDTGPPPTFPNPVVPVPGSLKWTSAGATPDSFTIIVFQDGETNKVFLAPGAAAGDQYYDTGLGGDLASHGVVIYPKFGSLFGSGGWISPTGTYLNPPVGGAPPHPPVAGSPSPAVRMPSGKTKIINPVKLGVTFSDTSNTYYVGREGSVYGHVPSDALDGKNSTFWLSIANQDRNAGYAFEWFEVNVKNAAISEVHYTSAKTGYEVFISVFSNGKWISHQDDDVIPYNAHLPESHNGGNIPFCERVFSGSSEGPHTVVMRAPIPNCTKVRITFRNLQDFGIGNFPYRAGLKEMSVYGTASASDTPLRVTPPAKAGPPMDDTSPSIASTYTVYIPPVEIPGAGEEPGLYEDYCVDTQTEALTQRGWLRWDQIQPGDMALGMDPTTRQMEWQPVKDVYRKHRKRTMISMESQLHSSLTTPNHRWLVVNQAGVASWATTETLKTGQRIPLAAPVQAPEAAKYDDDFVELVAWFWTEGWVNGEFGNACLAQSETANPVHTARIRASLTRLYGPAGRMLRGKGAMWNESRRKDGVVTFRLSKPVKDALLEVAPDKVVDTGFLCALTASQRTLFVERSLDADGWRTTGGRVGLAQRDERRAKAFEIACILDGRPIRTRQDWNGMWSVNLLRSAFTLPQSTVTTEIEYDDVVWCPTLEHHNWIARRAGTVYITGNTDIVKLFLAWGGFYWPEDASLRQSCGTETAYSWGQGLYGLKNVDPVLGGQDSGRVWGDFMDTGTAGIAQLPVPQWDKKSLLDCVSAGTPVLTRDGYVPIEQIQLGDVLPTATGMGRVVGIRTVARDEVVRVVVAGAEVVVSPGHRFLTTAGWRRGDELAEGCYLVGHDALQVPGGPEMRLVREALRGDEDTARSTEDLFGVVQEGAGSKEQDAAWRATMRVVRQDVQAGGGDEQVLLPAMSLQGQNDAVPGVRDLWGSLSAEDESTTGMLLGVPTTSADGKGMGRLVGGAVRALAGAWRRVAAGVLDVSTGVRGGFAVDQGGPRMSEPTASRGGRRSSSPVSESAPGGPGQGQLAGLYRVDCVEVHRRGDSDWVRFSGGNDQAVLYDLSVSGHPSFLIGKQSLVVHNCVSYVRDIIGFLFYIDEEGAAVWRLPNLFSVGNYQGNRSAVAGRVSEIVTIDETQTLLDLTAKLSSRNVRERFFIASVDGTAGALSTGYNPNPTGLRRVGGWCVDTETEILTRRGWLHYNEVKVGDETLSLDQDGCALWQPIREVAIFEAEPRTMVRISANSFDALTTPNHRWYTQTYSTERLCWERQYRTTDSLTRMSRVERAAAGAAHPSATIPDWLVELVAWTYTEGSVQVKGAWRRVTLYQSPTANPDNCESIRLALKTGFGDEGWTSKERNGCVEFVLRPDASRQVVAYLTDTKAPTMAFLTSLTQEQIELFIDISVRADGWVRGGRHRSFAQNVGPRLDSFLAACALAGIATSCHLREGEGRFGRSQLAVVSLFTEERHASIGQMVRDDEDYDGVVWCPAMPTHHNWLARRGGAVYYTGNTDQHFGSSAECQIMADMIALRALMSFRVDTLQIPGYPRIQVDDQVRIFEQITNEGYLHYVRGIASSNDLESGVWTYDLDTNWLGEAPFEKWAFDPAQLSKELQEYLSALSIIGSGTDPLAPPVPGPTSSPPSPTPTTTQDVPKVAKLVQVSGQPSVYITDGITKRHVLDPTELGDLVAVGLVPSRTPTMIKQATLDAIPNDAS